MISVPVVLAGACVGAGLGVIVRSLAAPVPDLSAALRRLDATSAPAPSDVDAMARSRGHRSFDAGVSWLVDALALRRYRADLDLVGETPETLAVRKLGYGLLGLLFPPVLVAVMALIGVVPPVAIPVLVSVVLGATLFMVPDLDVRRRATAARHDVRRTVCAYLELVALERAGDAGAVEALERAATVADSPAFVRIRDALTRAQLAGVPPWSGLSALAEQVGVAELEDLADIMRLSGEDGAAVYTTLRARAASLRSQMLSADAAAANAASEHMIVPVALLGIAFMALIGYPAFARILFG